MREFNSRTWTSWVPGLRSYSSTYQTLRSSSRSSMPTLRCSDVCSAASSLMMRLCLTTMTWFSYEAPGTMGLMRFGLPALVDVVDDAEELDDDEGMLMLGPRTRNGISSDLSEEIHNPNFINYKILQIDTPA